MFGSYPDVSSHPIGTRDYLRIVQNVSGAHPTFCSMGTLVFFPGVKRPERDGDHPHSAQVNKWSHVLFRLCDFMAWRGEARSVGRKS